MYVADVTSLFGPFVKFVVEEVGGGYTVVNPRRACAARVTVGLCVCLSSLISDLARIHVQQETPTASALHG